MKNAILRTEIVNLIMGIALVLGSYLIFHNLKIPLSAAIGSVIGGANFWILATLTRKMLDDKSRKPLVVLGLVLKFLLLMFILWAVIKWVPVSAIAFLIGLSTVILAIVVSFLFYA